eukprot:3283086-Prymnesium_polylepis.1
MRSASSSSPVVEKQFCTGARQHAAWRVSGCTGRAGTVAALARLCSGFERRRSPACRRTCAAPERSRGRRRCCWR